MGTSYLLVQVQKQEEGYFLVAARCLFHEACSLP